MSLRRVASFLRLEESTADWPAAGVRSTGCGRAPPTEVGAAALAQPALSMRGAAFSWTSPPAPDSSDGGSGGSNETECSAVLEGLDLQVEEGELCVVLGEVGSGKSALLAALLGELHCLAGERGRKKAAALCPTARRRGV